MLITVIVPIYNMEAYLCTSLDRLLQQSFQDYEILLIDDGSKDSSGEICDRYAREHSRIRVVHKPNGGLSTARNAGIEHARGEYLTKTRLYEATELLTHTSLNVTEIAIRCGFNDGNYFGDAFRKEFGLSPLQYRKRQKNLL